jgi:hypothetical protein
MSNCVDFDRGLAIRPSHRAFRFRNAFFIAIAAAMLLISLPGFAEAQSFRQGVSAFNRQDYVSASRVFIPLAEQGVPSAQSSLGFMFVVPPGRGAGR